MTTIEEIIERAASDPDFLRRLVKDPIGTAREEGYQVSTEDVRTMLGMPPEASDQEVVEVLRARLSHSGILQWLIGLGT